MQAKKKGRPSDYGFETMIIGESRKFIIGMECGEKMIDNLQLVRAAALKHASRHGMVIRTKKKGDCLHVKRFS